MYYTFDVLLQVPHANGKISQLYNLHVLVPSAFILGSDEYHVGVGSSINLVCIIENVSWRIFETQINAIKYRLSVRMLTRITIQ